MDELDFWIGSWDCSFEGGRAHNQITREYAGNVVVERFRVVEGETFEGTSVSVLGRHDQRWRQTWVDSDGSYWAFVGSRLPEGGFEFRTPEAVDADHLFKRMVFADITVDAFSWRWEFSADGSDWDEKWAISYRRAAPGIS